MQRRTDFGREARGAAPLALGPSSPRHRRAKARRTATVSGPGVPLGSPTRPTGAKNR